MLLSYFFIVAIFSFISLQRVDSLSPFPAFIFLLMSEPSYEVYSTSLMATIGASSRDMPRKKQNRGREGEREREKEGERERKMVYGNSSIKLRVCERVDLYFIV
jgi:hypothetical protein